MASNDSIVLDIEMNTKRLFEELKSVHQTLENFARSVSETMKKQAEQANKQTERIVKAFNAQAKGVRDVNKELKEQDNWFRVLNRSALALNATVGAIVFGVKTLADKQLGEVERVRKLGFQSNASAQAIDRMGVTFENLGLRREAGQQLQKIFASERAEFAYSGASPLMSTMMKVLDTEKGRGKFNPNDMIGTFDAFIKSVRELHDVRPEIALQAVKQGGLMDYADLIFNKEKDFGKAWFESQAVIQKKDERTLDNYLILMGKLRRILQRLSLDILHELIPAFKGFVDGVSDIVNGLRLAISVVNSVYNAIRNGYRYVRDFLLQFDLIRDYVLKVNDALKSIFSDPMYTLGKLTAYMLAFGTAISVLIKPIHSLLNVFKIFRGVVRGISASFIGQTVKNLLKIFLSLPKDMIIGLSKGLKNVFKALAFPSRVAGLVGVGAVIKSVDFLTKHLGKLAGALVKVGLKGIPFLGWLVTLIDLVSPKSLMETAKGVWKSIKDTFKGKGGATPKTEDEAFDPTVVTEILHPTTTTSPRLSQGGKHQTNNVEINTNVTVNGNVDDPRAMADRINSNSNRMQSTAMKSMYGAVTYDY